MKHPWRIALSLALALALFGGISPAGAQGVYDDDPEQNITAPAGTPDPDDDDVDVDGDGDADVEEDDVIRYAPAGTAAPVVVVDDDDELRDAPADEDRTYPFGGVSLGPRFSLFKPNDGGDWTGHGGLQLRFHLGKVFALEGSAEYRRRILAGGARADIFPVQASLLAYLFPNKFHLSPYILGGAGWYHTHIDTPADDDTVARFGGHAGGGLQLWLNRHWSINGDYRHIWLEDIRTPDARLIDRDFTDAGHQISAGLNYHF